MQAKCPFGAGAMLRASQRSSVRLVWQNVQLNKQQLDKLNKLRKLAGIEAITLEQQDTCC